MKKKLVILFLTLVVLILSFLLISPSKVNAGPGTVCKPVGCAGGAQLCADVTIGPVTWHCYEKKPVK